MFAKLNIFLGEVKTELKKTSWPTRRELLDATVVVIVATILLAIYVGGVDYILAKIVSLVIK